ncbi:MYND-type domain-containing protein [Mycena kentingensis (nom. inval.)]|nr:MYND-type domain-containing protein [Mycena kentingensis (nom. inval.)]
MSRAKDIKFTPASKGDSYDKMSNCWQCLKSPIGKKPFMVCAACKEVSFCSKECQKTAWPKHKPICQHRKEAVAAMADTPSSATFPPFQIRKRLLTDFIEVHECSIRSALYSALILAGHMESFPYATRAMRIFLRYNPACGENPSTAYDLVAHTWFDDAALNAQIRGGSYDPAALVGERGGMRIPGLCGWLRVYFQIEDHVVQEMYPQARRQDVLGNALEVLHTHQIDHRPWFDTLQKTVRDGLVKRALTEESLVMQMGKMWLKKGKWVWVALTDEELAAGGHAKQIYF